MQSEGVILRVNSTFNTTELEFSSPTVTSTGAIMIPFSFQGHPLYLQTPIVSCPVGFRVFTSNNGTHKLLINPTSEMNSMIQRIDDFVIDTILSRSQEWFNKTFVSRDIVQALFYNSLKQNKTYPISGWDVVQMQLCSDTTINTKTCLFQDGDDDSVSFV